MMPTQAHATAYAWAAIDVQNLSMTVDDAQIGSLNPVTSATGFSTFKFTESQVTTTLNGSTNISAATIIKTTSGSSLDQAIIGQGNTGSFVNNVYFPTPAINALASNYVVADSHELDTNIFNTPSGHFGAEAGAQVDSAGAVASTVAANTLSWGFTVINASASHHFIATVHWHREQTAIQQTTLNGEDTNNQLNFTIDMSDPADDQQFTIDNFSNNIAGNQSPKIVNKAFNQQVTQSVTFDFTSTGEYTLDISFLASAQADATGVPEPTSLSLLGAGLIGLGAVARRRRRIAA